MLGSRALYHEGWKAVTYKPLGPMSADTSPNTFMGPFDEDIWELYHVEVDPSEVHDLADAEPQRLARMVDLWWEEAERFHVLPLDNRILYTILNPPPNRILERSRYRYVPFGAPVPESVAADVRNRSHEITASVRIDEGVVPEGVLLAIGCVLGGWSFHVLDGRLRYVHNLYGKSVDVIEADRAFGGGAHTLGFRYEKVDEEGGTGELLIDGEVVGQGPIARFTPIRYNNTGAGLSCGYELGPPVGSGYDAPFRWNSELTDVVVEVSSWATEPVCQAIDCVRPGGTVVLAGVKGFRPVPDFVSDKIVLKEITVRGAIGVTSSGYRSAIRLIESGRVPLERMHTHRFGLDEAELAIRTLAREIPGEESIHSCLVPET